MPVPSKARSFPWSQLVVGVFAIILFAVWWNLRQRDDEVPSGGLITEEQAEIIEQEQAIDPERSFLNDSN